MTEIDDGPIRHEHDPAANPLAHTTFDSALDQRLRRRRAIEQGKIAVTVQFCVVHWHAFQVQTGQSFYTQSVRMQAPTLKNGHDSDDGKAAAWESTLFYTRFHVS